MTTSPRDPKTAGLSTPAGMGTDPPPTHPVKPLPFDCCESGCARCVFDIYDEELAGYQSAMAAWRARHPDADATDLSARRDPAPP